MQGVGGKPRHRNDKREVDNLANSIRGSMVQPEKAVIGPEAAGGREPDPHRFASSIESRVDKTSDVFARQNRSQRKSLRGEARIHAAIGPSSCQQFEWE